VAAAVRTVVAATQLSPADHSTVEPSGDPPEEEEQEEQEEQEEAAAQGPRRLSEAALDRRRSVKAGCTQWDEAQVTALLSPLSSPAAQRQSRLHAMGRGAGNRSPLSSLLSPLSSLLRVWVWPKRWKESGSLGRQLTG
jgi:hypothetical protein